MSGFNIGGDGFANRDVGKTEGDEGDESGTSDRHKGWYSRGYLPHLDQPGLWQFITFRLGDSVPRSVVEQWKAELSWRESMSDDDPVVAVLIRRLLKYEDAGYGACWLRDERIATLVETALLHFDAQRYRLVSWCIMPNHVHVLIETFPRYPIYKVLHSWKSFTALKANQLLGRNGPFWAHESFDRFIRDDDHLARTIAYIERNPVKAGFVQSADQWKFGSASRPPKG